MTRSTATSPRRPPRRLFRDRREAGVVLPIHTERTRTGQPLEPTGVWIDNKTPETYPSGL